MWETLLHKGMSFTFNETIIGFFRFLSPHFKKYSREEENKNVSLAAFHISLYTQKITDHP